MSAAPVTQRQAADRYQRVLNLISVGCSTRQIASKIGVGYDHAKMIVRRLLRLYEVDNRSQLMAVAWRAGDLAADEAAVLKAEDLPYEPASYPGGNP